MHPIVADNLDAIRALAREYGVARLELFGSAATSDFDPARSDVDFIIEYPTDYEFGPWLTHYFDLKDRPEALLGHPVDLVMAGAMRNHHFVASANETRQVLYAT